MTVTRLVPLLCVATCFGLVCSELYFLAERLPLQGSKPYPGTPWPMPKVWHRMDQVKTFDPTNLTFSSNLQNCDIVDESIRRFKEFLRSTDESVNPTKYTDEPEGDEGKDGVSSPSGVTTVSAVGNYTNQDGVGNVSDIEANTALSDTSSVTTESSVQQQRDQGAVEGEEEVTEEFGISQVVIHVMGATCPGYPQHGMNEEYNLTVDTEIHIATFSVWGLVRGLETLQQLMYTVQGKWYINAARIEDAPRFSYRGMLIDTARHFYPVEILKKNLDAMATHKYNVFHWHIVDAQSFPYRSIKFPDLAEKGAFSPKLTYSQEDVQDIIEYARYRGIRVLPEFDTPGHAHSWGIAMPELLTPCWAGGEPGQANYSYHAERENFDPSKNSTFQFLEEFFHEIKDVFKDEFFHMGMDEAHYMCWESSPDIAAFMEASGFGHDFYRLEEYYNVRLLDIVQRLMRKSIIYEDPINHGVTVPNDTIIQAWKDVTLDPHLQPWQSYVEQLLTTTDYHVILSSCWYLNKIYSNQDWRRFYACDPASVNATDEQLFRILGGEACVWSEYLDEYNVLQSVWPRASAVAERLWSPANVTDIDDAQLRLDQHRCRLLRQGIPARPVLAGYCLDDYNIDNSRSHLYPTPSTLAPQDTTQSENTPTSSTEEGDAPFPSSSTSTTAKGDNSKDHRSNTNNSNKKSGHNGSNGRVTAPFTLAITSIVVAVCLFKGWCGLGDG